MGSSKVFLTGASHTEKEEYSQVVRSTMETLRRRQSSQMIILLGPADLRAWTLLSQSLSSQLELSEVFSVLLPLLSSHSEDGLTPRNTASLLTQLSLSPTCDSVSNISLSCSLLDLTAALGTGRTLEIFSLMLSGMSREESSYYQVNYSEVEDQENIDRWTRWKSSLETIGARN